MMRRGLAFLSLAALHLALTGCPPPVPYEECDSDAPPSTCLNLFERPDIQALVDEPVGLEFWDLLDGYEASWTFGDGEQATGAGVSHAWSEPGHYPAVLQITGPAGFRWTDGFVVSVVHEPLAEPPSSSSTLALGGDLAYAVMTEHGLLAVVDLRNSEVSHIDAGVRPRSVAWRDGLLAIASEDDTVRLIRDNGPPIEVPTGYGSRPFGVAIASDETVWVTLQGTGELLALREDGDWAIASRTALGPDLRGLAVTDNAVVVTRFRSDDDAGDAWLIDPDTLAVLAAPLARDPGPDSDTGARGVPTYLQRVAVRPDGRVAALAGTQANVERGLWRDGQPLTHETSVRATIRQVALHPDEAPRGDELALKHFDDRGLASAVAFDARGEWMFVAMHGMETVDVVNPYTRELAGSFPNVGHGPQGLAVAPSGVLWVHSALSRELVAFSTDDFSAIPTRILSHDLQPPTGEVWTPEQARGAVVFHRSADVRMTKDGYVSCGSCHFDGEPDGRTWDFTDRSEGLRNTHSLLGGGIGPLHHSGNFDELQDFENDIRGPQEGAGFLTGADWETTQATLGDPKAGLSPELDDLTAFIESLPHHLRSPHRDEAGALTPDATAGQALFEDPALGCVDCHPAPSFTDSQWLEPGVPLLHDVGTLVDSSGQRMDAELLGIDTPSLRGVFATPPYLHDGSAPTIRGVLDRNDADLHGVTSHLSPEQLDQLAAYVLSIE